MIDFKIASDDIGLYCVISRAYVRKFWNHMRISVNRKLAKYFTLESIGRLSNLFRVTYGRHCLYYEMCVHVGVAKVSEEYDSI